MQGENHIKLLSFSEGRKFTHQAYKEKGWKSIGTAEIQYYDITVSCNLIKGRNEDGNREFFYFLELPCARHQIRGGKWVKRNFLNFEETEDNRRFQEYAFGLILEAHPELFDSVFLEERKRVDQSKQEQFKAGKARNVSKFAKGAKNE